MWKLIILLRRASKLFIQYMPNFVNSVCVCVYVWIYRQVYIKCRRNTPKYYFCCLPGAEIMNMFSSIYFLIFSHKYVLLLNFKVQ